MGITCTIPDTRDGEYYFDQRVADAACAFFPRYIRLFEGEWAGQPLELMDWQRKIISDCFGWKRTKDHTRRYRTVYVWIPRKNTKSTTAAGVGLLLLIGDAEPGAKVYTLASTEDQAKIVFNFAGNMVANSPDLAKLITPFKTSLWLDETGGVMMPLTGKAQGKHGLNAHAIIGDEIHEWPSDELYTFVHQSEGTRRQPMDFLISTAGKRDGVGWEHWKLCEAILNGEIDAPDTYVFIASADKQRDSDDPNYWTTEEAVRESNPGLGHTVKLDFLMSEIEKAKTNPRRINDIKRYYLNLWVDQATVWLNMARWDKCAWPDEPQPEKYLDVTFERKAVKEESVLIARQRSRRIKRSEMPIIYRSANMRWKGFSRIWRGRKCFAGLDLSATTDLTAGVFIFPPDDNFPLWGVIPRFYCPGANIEERVKRDSFDYKSAALIGAINLTEGDVVDYDFVRDDFLSHASIFQCEKTAIDRWNALQIATQIQAAGVEIQLFGQGFASMSAPTKFLERIVLLSQFDHGGHPVLRWNARNVAVSKDGAENIKPVKDKSTGRIDGVVGAIMGLGISDMLEELGELKLDAK